MENDRVVAIVLVMAMAGPIGGVPVDFNRPGIQDAVEPQTRVKEVGTTVVIRNAGGKNFDAAAVCGGENAGADDPVLPEMAQDPLRDGAQKKVSRCRLISSRSLNAAVLAAAAKSAPGEAKMMLRLALMTASSPWRSHP